jgi:hypothetical protein
MLITTPCNVDYLTKYVRVRIGDSETPYRYSDAVVRTALVTAVTSIAHLWDTRYFIYDPLMDRGTQMMTPFGLLDKPTGLQDYDAIRNPTIEFSSEPPPIIDPRDEFPIVCAAAILCLRARLSSDMSSLISWQTPDFSYSANTVAKQLSGQIEQYLDELKAFFSRRLGRPVLFVI